ncbi:MAG: FAD-dependent thymidylate synthase [Tepidisphaeraceae bacterium]
MSTTNSEIEPAVQPEPVRIIRQPSVYLVGKSSTSDEDIDRFLADHRVEHWTTDTDQAGQKLSEIAGRVCYMSFAKPRPGGNSAYLRNIIEVGHGSVLEHATYNFILTGVSRSFTHELIRHRAGFGYSQLSQRYVDESQCNFVEPEAIADDPKLHELFAATVAQCQRAYVELTEGLSSNIERLHPELSKTDRRKIARQAARAVLPNATETKIFVTANARALRHFFFLRGNLHAEDEIRAVAIAMWRVLRVDSPNFFSDFELREESGKSVLFTPFPKV